ncbi:MAG: hypothetical protein JNK89_02790 [Saprospiraceae bacterium]|nr:hypothetical protein [Saprospiraceae bacterium]
MRSDPPVRYAGFGFSIGNKGYFGGGGNNDFWEFDPAGNADGLGAWRELDPMPAAISFTQARTYKNSAIVVGGRDGTFGFTDKVWKFNLEL